MFLKFILVVGLYFGYVSAICNEEKRFGRMLDETATGAKDAELASEYLKTKLGLGFEDKELYEKGFPEEKILSHLGHEGISAGADLDYSMLLHKLEGEESSNEKNEFFEKFLKMALVEELKKEEFSEGNLKALAMSLAKLAETTKGGTLLSKELPLKTEEDHYEFPEGVEVKLEESHMSEDPLHDELEGKDVKTYLAESVGHEKAFEDEDRELFKAITETKAALAVEPYEKVHAQEAAYLKSMLQSEKSSQEEAYLKMAGILKKALEDMKAASFHSEGSFLDAKDLKIPFPVKGLPHPGVIGKEHVLKDEMAKYFPADKAFEVADEEALKKHKSHHEAAVTHKKDVIYDEILRHEEADEEGFETKISSEDGKEIYHHFPSHGLHKDEETGLAAKAFSKEEFLKSEHRDLDAHASDEIKKGISLDKAVKSEEAKGITKELASKDILKEGVMYMAGGTRAYEKARDQAHVDAKVPLVEKAKDEAGKEIFHDSGFGKGKFLPESKLYGEEAFKTGISLGKDKELVDAKEATRKIFEEKDIGGFFSKDGTAIFEAKGKEEGILKESAYGVKADEEHFLHGIGAAEKGIHWDEEGAIHKTVQDAGKSHSKAHSLKSKFLGFIRHILRMQKCHLVSMRPGELLAIVNCISRSKDPVLCEKFAMCEKKMPLQVIHAMEKCQKETIPGQALRCSKYEPLFPSPEIPLKIFKCIVKNIRELTPEEKKLMIDFEECARQVKMESCGKMPWG